MTNLKVGDRVHVKGHWNWPNDCVGVVSEPPAMVRPLAGKHPWHGHLRSVPGRTGMIPFVWIMFDERQMDGDGDGPYRGGEVELEFVTLCRERTA
jgi:hypothetical protein